MRPGVTRGSSRSGAGIHRHHAFLVVGLLGLCNCSLAFDLDSLQGSPDTNGDQVAGTERPLPAGDLLAPGPIDAPTASGSTDSGVGMMDALAATISDPAVDGAVAVDAMALGDETLARDAMTPGDGMVAEYDMSTGSTVVEGGGSSANAPEGGTQQGSTPLPVDAGSWCAANTTQNTAYCDDFDEPTSTIKGTWDAVGLNGVDCASLDSPADAPSGPNTLLLSTPLVPAGMMYHEQFTKYPTGVNSLSLQFAVKIVDFDPNGKDVSLVRIGYRYNGWGVSLDLFGTAAQLLETVPQPNGDSQDIVHPVAQAPLGVWTVVTLTVDTVTNEVSLSYDGKPVLITNATLTSPQIADPAFSVFVGANYFLGPLQPMKISYDNVLVSVN
jgi:hypothetical protein